MKFVTSLDDAGSPYTSEQWQSNFGNPDGGLVLDANQSSVGLFSLLHDSYNAYPTFAILDHTMTVRGKPWTLTSNGNTNSCDGNSNLLNGWSGGNTASFLQQLVDECGSLCEGCSGDIDTDGDGLADECDDCNNMSGDINDDMMIDILDIVTVVNMILTGGINSSDFTECEKSDGDFDGNGTINILDVIQIINVVLGTNRLVDTDNNSYLDAVYDIEGEDLILTLSSESSLSGLQLSFYSDHLMDISINDNQNRSDLYLATDLHEDIQSYVVFSMENSSFDNNSLELVIENGSMLDIESINILAGSKYGNELELRWNISEVQNFKLNKVSPNPFNPATQVEYEIDQAGQMILSVYNVTGQKVSELYNGYQSEGTYNVVWDASEMSSGVYYISMLMNGHQETMKAVLVK